MFSNCSNPNKWLSDNKNKHCNLDDEKKTQMYLQEKEIKGGGGIENFNFSKNESL